MTPIEKQQTSQAAMTVEVIAATHFAPTQNVVTLVATYPRIIHSELMTQTLLAKNAASSRAVPIATMIEKVRNRTFVPWHWKSNKRGMSGGEPLGEEAAAACRLRWIADAEHACASAEFYAKQGLLKGLANRPLEPYSFIQTLVTTRLEYLPHFLSLRDHPAAEDHFHDLAALIREKVKDLVLKTSGDHLPFVSAEEAARYPSREAAMVSAVRCRRVSYFRLDTKDHPVWADDYEQAKQMVAERPMHASPFEHQALRYPGGVLPHFMGRLALPTEHNALANFMQFRKMIPGEFLAPSQNWRDSIWG